MLNHLMNRIFPATTLLHTLNTWSKNMCFIAKTYIQFSGQASNSQTDVNDSGGPIVIIVFLGGAHNFLICGLC